MHCKLDLPTLEKCHMIGYFCAADFVIGEDFSQVIENGVLGADLAITKLYISNIHSREI